MTPELMRLAKEYPAFYQRALKSLGWMGQKEIKKGIASGAPGGKAYPNKIPPARRRVIDHIFGRERRGGYPVLGKLRQAVGYDKRYIKEGTVIIGWLSKTAVEIGTKMEKGITYPVSKKMRGKFYHGGLFVRKPQIVIPARPTFTPMKSVIEKEAVAYLTKKMHEYINNPSKRGNARSKRRYRVYES